MIIGPGIPAEVAQALRDIERDYVARLPKSPVRLPHFAQADLPSAADHKYGVVIVTNLNILAHSDGSNWVRQDTGAAI